MDNNTIIPHTQWLSEKNVSKMLGVSLSTLQKHRFYGKGIPYSKFGRSVRYATADVLTYMESTRVSFTYNIVKGITNE